MDYGGKEFYYCYPNIYSLRAHIPLSQFKKGWEYNATDDSDFEGYHTRVNTISKRKFMNAIHEKKVTIDGCLVKGMFLVEIDGVSTKNKRFEDVDNLLQLCESRMKGHHIGLSSDYRKLYFISGRFSDYPFYEELEALGRWKTNYVSKIVVAKCSVSVLRMKPTYKLSAK